MMWAVVLWMRAFALHQGGPWAGRARLVTGKRGRTGRWEGWTAQFQILGVRFELPAIAPFLVLAAAAFFLFTLFALAFLPLFFETGAFLGTLLLPLVPFAVLIVCVRPARTFIFVCLIAPIVAVSHIGELLIVNVY